MTPEAWNGSMGRALSFVEREKIWDKLEKPI